MREMGIYVHIPFCQKKCAYCDFCSYENQTDLIDGYMNYVLKEIQETAEGTQMDCQAKLVEPLQISSIYIGGGTPSFIPAHWITQIMDAIRKGFSVKKDVEISMEANPGTLDKSKLETYLAAGINRLSIGVQSTNNHLLKKLGRIHTYEQFLENYKLARQVGFQNINLDFMIGLPDQSLFDIKQMVQEIQHLQPEHVSVYSLILEENTKMMKEYQNGKIKLPSDELEREMYWYTKKHLEQLGYQHYEISNFAKKGYWCQHNLDCWNQKEYMGFGVSAHSYTDLARYSNIEDIPLYIQNFQKGEEVDNIVIHEVQKQDDQMKEYMMLGFRKLNGIDGEDFYQKFHQNMWEIFADELSELWNEGLITIKNDQVFLTNKGLDLANLVFEAFC